MKNRILAGITAMCLIGGTVVILECVAPVVSMATSAGTDTYGNLTYKINIVRETITITDCDESATNIIIPREIQGMPVTVIGMDAFKYCSNLVSVTIPDSVITIYPMAFYKCSNLTSITIPDSVTNIDDSAFAYCSGLTSITIPDSVTSIGISAFGNCSGLTSVTIPSSVTIIDSSAFYGCNNIADIYYAGTKDE